MVYCTSKKSKTLSGCRDGLKTLQIGIAALQLAEKNLIMIQT